MVENYNDFIVLNLLGINLVGSKEGEASMSTLFQQIQASSSFNNIKHYSWDYHAQGLVWMIKSNDNRPVIGQF